MVKKYYSRIRDLARRTRGFKRPNHHTRRGFANTSPDYRRRKIRDELRWIIAERPQKLRSKRQRPVMLETIENDGAFFRMNRKVFTVTWAGHSTVLLQMAGLNILLDPVWSDRASPVPFAGPRRFVEPGISLANLPHIDVIAISHNHYDHFDRATVKKLGRGTLFVVPLGFGRILERMGIRNHRELDWWQGVRLGGVEIHGAPAQHGSRRTLHDRDRSLWCSWMIRGGGRSVFFAGDTGYFGGFKEIGERYGPIDLACLPIGAYLPREHLEHLHMSPGEALRAFHDLRARAFLPIHWGTFDLGSDHPHQAMEELEHLIDLHGLDRERFLTLRHGETRLLDSLDVLNG